MSNPYEPPRAPVADVESPIVREPRPRGLTIGLVILWIMLVLRALGSTQQIAQTIDVTEPEAWSYLAYLVGLVIVPAFLFVKIAQGRVWARTVATVLFGADVMLRIYLAFFDRVDAQFLIGFIISTGVPAIAYGLLYLPASNAWFRSRRVAE